jgi:hypothetical protein
VIELTIDVVLQLCAGALTVAAAVVGFWLKYRDPSGRSPRVERLATSRFRAAGYFGKVSVATNLQGGDRWHVDSYYPDPRDPPPRPEDQGRKVGEMMREISGTLPLHYWSDRRMAGLLLFLAVGAAFAALASVLA